MAQNFKNHFFLLWYLLLWHHHLNLNLHNDHVNWRLLIQIQSSWIFFHLTSFLWEKKYYGIIIPMWEKTLIKFSWHRIIIKKQCKLHLFTTYLITPRPKTETSHQRVVNFTILVEFARCFVKSREFWAFVEAYLLILIINLDFPAVCKLKCMFFILLILVMNLVCQLDTRLG